MAKFYAVKQGRKCGIYNTWAECQEQIKGFSGAVYKSFATQEEADNYLGFNNIINPLFEDMDLCIPPNVEKSSDFMDYLGVDECVAYVDGSNTNSRVGSGVCLMFGSATEKPEAVALRNVAGEINSAMIAMHAAKLLGKKKITVIYDYAGIEQWATGGWSTKNPMAAAYKSFFDSITDQRKTNSIEVEFVKVKGHSGIEGNEIVDRVAKRMAGVM